MKYKHFKVENGEVTPCSSKEYINFKTEKGDMSPLIKTLHDLNKSLANRVNELLVDRHLLEEFVKKVANHDHDLVGMDRQSVTDAAKDVLENISQRRRGAQTIDPDKERIANDALKNDCLISTEEWVKNKLERRKTKKFMDDLDDAYDKTKNSNIGPFKDLPTVAMRPQDCMNNLCAVKGCKNTRHWEHPCCSEECEKILLTQEDL